MAHNIPLIRSAVLFPMLDWLRAHQRPVEPLLDAADLRYVSLAAPERPIPISSVLTFFRAIGEAEGPDIAARVIATTNLAQFGAFGRIIQGSPTLRVALRRVVCVLPRYSTHELLALHPVAGGIRIEAGWSLVLDQDMVLMTQQFTAAVVRMLCMATPLGAAAITRIAVAPHPVHGIAHLRPWLGDTLVAVPGPTLAIDIADAGLDAPLSFDAEAVTVSADWRSLVGDGSFAQSVRLLIEAMANDPPVTMVRVAQAAGMSPRSLQRALHMEGTSYRRLTDALRRDKVIKSLPLHRSPLLEAAHDAGYAAQSSLSRAVRRWTGSPPRELRAVVVDR